MCVADEKVKENGKVNSVRWDTPVVKWDSEMKGKEGVTKKEVTSI